MRVPAMLFVYADNGPALERVVQLVREDQRFGFVRYKAPKFWPTSGIAELLTVPGAKYNDKTETWSFEQAKPDVWIMHGSPHAAEIAAAYGAVKTSDGEGVSVQIVGAPDEAPKPKRKKRAKKAAKKATAKKADPESEE